MNSFIQFLAPSQNLSVAYLSTYDMPLVVLSLLMAIFASFMALELSGRIAHAASAIGKIVWLVPGALALGGGVWAMHFIGMLAFSLPCGISYDPVQTLVSMAPGVAASAVALWTIGRTDASFGKLVFGGILMGGGIGAMHYSGMAAMRLDAAIYYSPTIFALSIGFAVVLAILSLHAKFVFQRQQNTLPKWVKSIAAAVFMGVAISGMHYIAMEAAYFIPVGDSVNTISGISPTILAAGIGITTLMLVALALAGAILGRYMETINDLEREVSEREQAENALRDSEERFRALANYTPNKLHIKDTEGRYVLINRKSEELFRVTNEEIEGKTAADIFPSEIGAAFNAHDRTVMETGKPVEAEESFFLDGGVHTYLTVKFPILGANGDIVAVGSSGFEISEQKEAQKELRRSEERFRDFASAASDWFWEMGPDLRFSNFSEQASERLGLPSDSLIGRTRREIGQAGSNSENWEAHLTDLDAHRPFRDFEYEVKHGNFISVSGIPAFDNNGEFLGYRGTGTNITERRKAEQRLRDAIESISEGFVLYDKDDRLVICNSKYREIYKESAEVIAPGATFEEILRFAVEHDQIVGARRLGEAFIKERVAKHQNPTEVIEQHLSDGRWLRIEERKTSDGGIVGIRTDITQLKNTEAELIEHRDHLEGLVTQRTNEVQEKAIQLETALVREKEYNILQQKFVALVSHEFRTPLSIIDGMAQRLIRRKDKLDANGIETRANKVRSAVTRMIGLIDTTLYASRLDAGKIEMQRGSNDIGELLLDVCQRQAEIAPDHQLNVEVEGLPNEMLIDRRLLDQVFTNLLSNAVKYAPQAPHIEVKGWQEDEDVVITVTDHGVGIPKDELPHMFGRFFRASTAEGFKGTGLGLSMCKEFVEMHGGTIEVVSVEGQGTTFSVRLPIDENGQ